MCHFIAEDSARRSYGFWLFILTIFFVRFEEASAESPIGPTAQANANYGCTRDSAGILNCGLALGDSLYSITVEDRLRLKNTSGLWMQIDQVQAVVESEPFTWSDYCLYMDTEIAGQYHDGFPPPGEVGCTFRKSGELYQPLRWSTSSRRSGLSVAPGQSVYIDAHTSSFFINHRFVVTVRPQRTGVYSVRGPKLNEKIVCNGALQSTAWTPWTNTTGRSIYLGGATIYAARSTPGPNEVQAACIYILRTDKSVKWSYCTQANQQGWVGFTPQTVLPGEALAGQAINTCPTASGSSSNPNFWSWAAYMHLWDYPPTS